MESHSLKTAPNRFSDNWILNHDNEPFLTALSAIYFWPKINLPVLKHPPYWPHFSSCDSFILPKQNLLGMVQTLERAYDIRRLVLRRWPHSPNPSMRYLAYMHWLLWFRFINLRSMKNNYVAAFVQSLGDRNSVLLWKYYDGTRFFFR